ncbi:ABC transporter substrate-binding protein [Neomoorella glycerini]|uniref:ABC transporter substrate-binding protein n=1 Tax=Neomoorella glycerini TaxID=55779 RepID=UPI001B8C10D2|nr:ABC transporter substrate-binding protein [Moorella glycerini]
MDNHGQPAPCLAEAWEMSRDGREWTFKLRQGVKFHDGVAFDADAVIANFNRYQKISPRTSPFYSFNIKEAYPGLKQVVKIDTYTVRLTFEKPQPTLPFRMVNFYSAIFSPRNFNDNGDFNSLPMGTGPFKLVEHKKDQYALLEAYENYWGKAAKTKRIRVRVIPEPETRLAALRAEEIMGVMDLGAIQPAQARDLLKDNRFAVSSAPSTITHYIMTNGTKPPFNDVRMRKALSLLVDRDFIVKELYYGYGTPAGSMLSNASPFHSDLKPEYNPEEAKRLARETLGNKKEKVVVIIPTYALDRYPYKAQAELVQSYLKQLGLDAEIRVLDGAAFNEAMKKGDYHIALRIQGLPNGEPDTLFRWFATSKGASNVNYSLGYNNPEVDNLIAKAEQELDIKRRKEIYNRIQEITARELPIIPLFYDVNLIAYNKRLRGYEAAIYGTTLPEMELASR